MAASGAHRGKASAGKGSRKGTEDRGDGAPVLPAGHNWGSGAGKKSAKTGFSSLHPTEISRIPSTGAFEALRRVFFFLFFPTLGAPGEADPGFYGTKRELRLSEAKEGGLGSARSVFSLCCYGRDHKQTPGQYVSAGPVPRSRVNAARIPAGVFQPGVSRTRRPPKTGDKPQGPNSLWSAGSWEQIHSRCRD